MSDDSFDKDIQKILKRALDTMTSDRDYWQNLAVNLSQPCTLNTSRDCKHCYSKTIVYKYIDSIKNK